LMFQKEISLTLKINTMKAQPHNKKNVKKYTL